MRNDDYLFSVVHLRLDHVGPQRRHSLPGHLQRLSGRQLVSIEVFVHGIETRMSYVIERQSWRRQLIDAAPLQDLLLAVLVNHLLLVEALECAVMTLVQPPLLMERDPVTVQLIG